MWAIYTTEYEALLKKIYAFGYRQMPADMQNFIIARTMVPDTALEISSPDKNIATLSKKMAVKVDILVDGNEIK